MSIEHSTQTIIELFSHLNIIRADVNLVLLAPICTLVDNHSLLWPLQFVGQADCYNLEQEFVLIVTI